jgi:sugar-phosphatase
MLHPAALLLDLDGTLVDSEPRHRDAHARFLASQGIQASDEVIFANIGKGDLSFYRELIDRHGVKGDPRAWMEQKTALLMDDYRIRGLALRPGVHDLLARASAAGIPCVVVTSAERRLCRLSLEVAGLGQRLPARVCHEDTREHKPHPAPYLLAAERLGVPPARCVVVEDSISGAAAGKAAGCTVLGYPGLVSAEELRKAGAERCISSLSQVLSAAPTAVTQTMAAVR